MANANLNELRYSGDEAIDWGALEVVSVHDYRDGFAMFAGAYMADRAMFDNLLREGSYYDFNDEGEPDWFEPRDYLSGRSHFDFLAESPMDFRVDWNEDALRQATSALHGERRDPSWKHTNATPNPMTDWEPTWATYGVVYKPPLAVVDRDLMGRIIENTALRLPADRSIRGIPGAFAWGGLVVRTTTTVAQVSHLASMQGVHFTGGNRENYPDALVVQAYRHGQDL